MMITVFPNYTDTTGKEISCSFEKMCLAFTHIRPKINKKKQKVWSPTLFTGTRSQKNAQQIGFIVFDCDDGVESPLDVKIKLDNSGYRYALHTSSSSKPTHPKYRIIIPLDSMIDTDMWEFTLSQANQFYKKLGLLGEPDQKALCDSARIYSLCYQSEFEFTAFNTNGFSFSFDYKPLLDALVKKKEEEEIRKARLFFSEYLHKMGISRHAFIPLDKHKKAYSETDESSRTVIANRLHALFPKTTLHSDRITNFPCPHCGQTDATYFYFAGGYARCGHHKKSCIGWHDSIYNLAKHYNIT